MICPTCERTCGDEEEVCLRCHTALRAPVVMQSPADETTSAASSGKSYGWIWGVLAVMLVGSCVRTCARLGRESAEDARPAPVVVDEAAAYRQGFLTAFNTACLKKGNPKSFCDCAGPKVLENFKEEEIDDVVESTRNGRPDVRMSTIIVQCSR